MASVSFQGLDKHISEITKLRDTTESACKYSLYEMAGVFADAITAAAHAHDRTGSLAESLDIHEMYESSGEVSTYISFSGYDSNKPPRPNPLKANILESGTSDGRVPKTHFFTNAVKGAKAAAEASAVAAFDEFTGKITKE